MFQCADFCRFPVLFKTAGCLPLKSVYIDPSMATLSKFLPLLVLIIFVFSCESDTTDLSERELAIQDYVDNYLGSATSDPGWTGDIATCNAGSVSETTNEKVPCLETTDFHGPVLEPTKQKLC